MHQHEEGAATGGLTGWPQSEYRKRKLDIQFTGSGSEYFRIWIVNLLLTIVTAGLYWPFAKARRIRYFYANTVIDGHALAFHGDAWKMFRGHLLMLVLLGAYSMAGRISLFAGAVAFVLMCVLGPALWRAGLQFRLRNTSWRGLRFGFDGALAGAYLPMLPTMLIGAAIVGIQLVFGPPWVGANGLPRMGTEEKVLLVLLLLAVLVTPWVFTELKRYQHNGYRIASQHAQVRLSAGSVYLLCLRAAGMGLIGLVLFFAVFFVGLVLGSIFGTTPGSTFGKVVTIVTIAFGYLLMFAAVVPYVTARFQNLLWNATSTEDLTVTSQLNFGPLLKLSVKNWLLTAITLGLYRPFAAVDMARMRLEAVSLTMDGDPETWVADQDATQTSAVGEFAGDFFGIDMGL